MCESVMSGIRKVKIPLCLVITDIQCNTDLDSVRISAVVFLFL